MTYLKGQGSGLLKFKGQGPEMVNVEEKVLMCRRPYPKNVHQPWPLALKSVSQSVSHKTRHPIPKKGRSHNSPHPEKGRGHKTRNPVPRKGSVTKLATASRKNGRSQNSQPHPEKRVGVTKLATPSRKRARFGD